MKHKLTAAMISAAKAKEAEALIRTMFRESNRKLRVAFGAAEARLRSA